jgi:outer membrane protein assembly factor BamE
MFSLRSVFAAIAATFALTACSFFSPYRIDIRQGNYVNDAMLAQLQLGMSREQVRFVLGSPLVADLFHSDRWDYIYRFQPGNGKKETQRQVSVFFSNDKLSRVENDTDPVEGQEPTGGSARIIEVPKAKK